MLSAAAERRAAQPRIRPPSPGTVDVDTDTSPSCVALSLLYKGTPRNFVRPADEALAKTLARVGRNVAKAALAALPKKERAHAKAPRVVARLLDADGRDVDSTLLNSAAWGIAAQLCLLDADDEAEAHYYDVRVDRPDVESVCVLHEALPGVRLAAAAAGLRGCAPDEIRWCWRRRAADSSAPPLSTDRFYTPTAEDEASWLEVEASPPGGAAPACTSVLVVSGAPPYAAGCSSIRRAAAFSAPPAPGQGLRCLSYNVLSSAYEEQFEVLYPYASRWALHTARRVQYTIAEALTWQAHIICLQEVDEQLYEDAWSPTLADNFGGDFCAKGADGASCEGGAVFWDSERLECVATRHVVLANEAAAALSQAEADREAGVDAGDDTDNADNAVGTYLLHMKREHGSAVLAVLLRVAQTAQLICLRELATGRLMLVCNTHLYYKKHGCRERTVQAALMMRAARTFRRELAQKRGWSREPALIVAGDLNAELHDLPARFLLADGGCEADDAAWRVDESGGEAPAGQGAALRCSPALECASGLHRWTNLAGQFEGQLDWVLVERGRVSALRHAPSADEDEARAATALPSEDFPSDHVAVACDVALLS